MAGVWIRRRDWRFVVSRGCAVIVAAGTSGGAEAAFRVEQKYARNDDLVPSLEA